MITQKTLWILWLDSTLGSIEVDGLIAYAYWRNKPDTPPPFPEDVWPEGTSLKDYEFIDIYSNQWYVLRRDIRLLKWPEADQWETVLNQTLSCMLETGALIAWFSTEGNFAEPPSLFEPVEMPPAGVYAALTKKHGFMCSTRLDQPYRGFTAQDFTKLRAII